MLDTHSAVTGQQDDNLAESGSVVACQKYTAISVVIYSYVHTHYVYKKALGR